MRQVKSEIAVMRHLFHRHVCLLFEVLDDPANDNIYLVMEVRHAMPCCPLPHWPLDALIGVGLRAPSTRPCMSPDMCPAMTEIDTRPPPLTPLVAVQYMEGGLSMAYDPDTQRFTSALTGPQN
jgi:hypothetical protein